MIKEDGYLAGWEECERQQWISVKTRLPDLSLKVVDVWIIKGSNSYRLANYPMMCFDVESLKEDFELQGVTHWRELPKPPQV